MNGKLTRRSTSVIVTALLGGLVLAPSAQAKDRYYLLEESYPSSMQCQQYSYVESMPVTTPVTVEKTVTIEKPVVFERSTRTIKTMRTTTLKTASLKRKRIHVAARPIRHRTHVVASRPTTLTRTTVQRTVATEPMLIERPLWVEQTVAKPVQVERPMIIEKAVEVDRPILLKKHHHMVELNLF
ncbi:MAG: hypothetical protein C5B53_08045 [Candidatus Melainabacteria bacterium]|nr:MAG: hypothetical protein C5B53_08045 [Candidatus Melainabacteria bacterium]